MCEVGNQELCYWQICDESRRGLKTCGLLMHPRGPPWYIGDPELPPMRVQGPHLRIGPLTPEVEGEMDVQPAPMTNVLTQSENSKSPALLSRKRRHPDEGEGEEEGEVRGGFDVVHSPGPVGIHGETSSHLELEDIEEREDGEEGMRREENEESDVEDILATFCSSPASDCS